MPANSAKARPSLVICGHVDTGKSTTTDRLLYDLGGLPERVQEKVKEDSVHLIKGSIVFAFYMGRQKEAQECGVTSACATQDFYTGKRHYTVVIAAPGHRDFKKDDDLPKKSDNMGWWKGCVVKYGKDCDNDSYKQSRHAELAKELKFKLVKDKRNKGFFEKDTPIMPILVWMGDTC